MRGEIWGFGPGEPPLTLLVVQADTLTEVAPTVAGLLVTTSEQEADYPVTVRLGPDETGVDRAAWVKVTQVHTVPVGDARRRIGRVTPGTMRSIDRALIDVLDLSR